MTFDPETMILLNKLNTNISNISRILFDDKKKVLSDDIIKQLSIFNTNIVSQIVK